MRGTAMQAASRAVAAVGGQASLHGGPRTLRTGTSNKSRPSQHHQSSGASQSQQENMHSADLDMDTDDAAMLLGLDVLMPSEAPDRSAQTSSSSVLAGLNPKEEQQ